LIISCVNISKDEEENNYYPDVIASPTATVDINDENNINIKGAYHWNQEDDEMQCPETIVLVIK